jgi:hypothetical protein
MNAFSMVESLVSKDYLRLVARALFIFIINERFRQDLVALLHICSTTEHKIRVYNGSIIPLGTKHGVGIAGH